MSKHNKKDKLNTTNEVNAEESAPLQQQSQSEASQGYTQQEVEQIVDEIVATPAPKRVWEVDFLRGFMILFVVWDHFMWDISDMGPYRTEFFGWLYELSGRYYAGALRKATHDVFVTLFVFTSGVSCSFSRNNGKRAIKMMVFALLFTSVTMAVSAITNTNVTMRFNVIHVIALSVLCWTGIEWIWSKCTKAWHKNLFGASVTALIVAVLVVGTCANIHPWEGESTIWYFLANHKPSASLNKFRGGDYLPFFPDFGWFLIGAFLGKMLYKERKSLFPSVDEKWVAPFTFCGRYSIWIYFGSQVVMYGLIYLFAGVLHWL